VTGPALVDLSTTNCHGWAYGLGSASDTVKVSAVMSFDGTQVHAMMLPSAPWSPGASVPPGATTSMHGVPEDELLDDAVLDEDDDELEAGEPPSPPMPPPELLDAVAPEEELAGLDVAVDDAEAPPAPPAPGVELEPMSPISQRAQQPPVRGSSARRSALDKVAREGHALGMTSEDEARVREIVREELAARGREAAARFTEHLQELAGEPPPTTPSGPRGQASTARSAP
jgi:hypothetical protein